MTLYKNALPFKLKLSMRCGRKEFLFFFIAMQAGVFLITMPAQNHGKFIVIYTITALIFYISAIVRRLRDLNLSALWLLPYIIHICILELLGTFNYLTNENVTLSFICEIILITARAPDFYLLFARHKDKIDKKQ